MSYWLFKTEPHVFSFADLAASPVPSLWDGVRNPEARNHLRDRVRDGDHVLVQHSAAKRSGANPASSAPHLAGIARVVGSGIPDPTAFDPASPGFDPASRPEAPRWFAVHLVAIQALAPVEIGRLRDEPRLQGLLLFTRPRLSIQPVSEAHWGVLLELARREEV